MTCDPRLDDVHLRQPPSQQENGLCRRLLRRGHTATGRSGRASAHVRFLRVTVREQVRLLQAPSLRLHHTQVAGMILHP